ncbi:hypothetical protein QYE76_067978 [Lolium multiflorum]|uniref:CCHC-type domain-containing protein n=1 Tax=Lolium multiflorum TaxID=4521 RepID=A0AAD8SFD0_LOLMU|nr:hypothetical protein QYE76_067978 [Lolium multiflorum]
MEHWTAVKNILKYLERTKDMFLCYGGDQELVVSGYTDASWNTDPDDSKSRSGYVFILNGAAVSWASSKQCTVAKSSTESEYIAASGFIEAVWMKRFIVELGVVPSALDPLIIYCDNMGAIANAQEPRSHKRLKHIKLRYHSIREYIEDGESKLLQIYVVEMVSPINFNQFLEKEKLKSNGSNFTDWFRHVRIFLSGGNLQYVLDAPLGDPPAETETDEVKLFTRLEKLGTLKFSVPSCSLESDLQKRFEHHDPHELMKELKAIFETHAAVECYEASKHFFSCMMEEGSSVSEHMLAMTGHAKKLSDLGIVIPNRLGINRVLQSLPPSYKNFVMNYNMQNMNKELPELFGMLKAAEIEIKKEHQVLMVNKTTSFKKQGKSKGKFKKGGKKAATPPMKPKNGTKPDAECYYCKEKGHWKRNCSKYLADLKSGLVKKKKEGMEHWTAVKNILKYLKRTKDMFLCYGGDQELVVSGYTDASWNTDPDDSKSQSGYVFILNGAAKLGKLEAVHGGEVFNRIEYIAASEASSEAVWMKRFIVELGVVPSALDPLIIYCDNMGAIANAQEPRSHKRLKHIKLRYHSIREYIEDGEVKICKVHTDLNVADPLTKALPRAKHDQHQNAMGVRYITM